jgi:signal transduction histidine kinase
VIKKLNIPLLIGISLLAVFLLLAIQWYLISTTFKYQNRQFEDELTLAVKDILDPHYVTDEQFNTLFQYAENLAKTYKNKEQFTGKALLDEFVNGVKTKDFYASWLKEELPQKGFSGDFEHAAVLTYLGLNDLGKPINTFLFDTVMMDYKVSGDLLELNHAFPVHSFTQSRQDYLIGMTIFLDVPAQRQIVFQRMWVLLILAGMSILGVVSIFLFTLRSLIRQKRLSDLKTDFINNITHEFKTPLATIHLATENLRNPKIQSKPSGIATLLDVIQRQKNRLQLLLDQVIETRIVSKDLQLQKEKVLIHEFLENRIKDFRMKLEGSNIELNSSYSKREVELNIDTFHFTTILFNLLDNAVKYANENPKIEVRTQLNNSEFSIEIEDNGIGMDAKNQNHIFDKFFRVESGNIHNVKGLGLGLFYVKQIVLAHGGDIRVKSKLGEGTTFTIVLPI